ncbi:MAG: hypothetical protein FJZ60_00440 [Chlamydiae bacterium]|nr:hypothetical protein [Chlamydiota bacterium]
MFLKCKLLAVLFCSALFGLEKSSPIIVPLETVKSLPSLYFSETMGNGQIKPDYKETLLEILQEDIQQSYHFDLVMGKLDMEPLVSVPLQKQVKELSAFKSDFILLPKIEQKKFILKLYESRFHTSTVVGEFPIKEKLDVDRLAMHQLFDALHQKIFQQSGIASSKILFCKKTADIDGEWISDIYEIQQDGSFLKKISTSQNYLITPIMIPKTKTGSDYEYLFVSYEKGQPKIFKGHSKHNQSIPLLPMRGNQLLPALSPLGDKIAFICDASGKTDLFLQQFHPSKGAIGKPIQLFSKPNSTQASPSFSPCGSKIAFVSDKDGSPKIYILEIIDAIRLQKTPPVRLLSANHKESTCPCWSLDGKKIAFCAMSEGYRQIWVLDLEKKIEMPITSGPIDKENPSWAPDSIHLVYNTTGQESQIYTIDIVKQKPVKLTEGDGISHFPSWEQR